MTDRLLDIENRLLALEQRPAIALWEANKTFAKGTVVHLDGHLWQAAIDTNAPLFVIPDASRGDHVPHADWTWLA